MMSSNGAVSKKIKYYDREVTTDTESGVDKNNSKIYKDSAKIFIF